MSTKNRQFFELAVLTKSRIVIDDGDENVYEQVCSVSDRQPLKVVDDNKQPELVGKRLQDEKQPRVVVIRTLLEEVQRIQVEYKRPDVRSQLKLPN
jgi:hypothetical protein